MFQLARVLAVASFAASQVTFSFLIQVCMTLSNWLTRFFFPAREQVSSDSYDRGARPLPFWNREM